jgi:hypothetical protein
MTRYRILVRGEFGDLLSNAFSDTEIEIGNGNTVLIVSVADSAALYGVLDRLRDFAIELVSFKEVNASGH